MKDLYNKFLNNKYVQIIFIVWNVMNFLKDLYEWRVLILDWMTKYPVISVSVIGIITSVIMTVIYWELLKWIFPEDY